MKKYTRLLTLLLIALLANPVNAEILIKDRQEIQDIMSKYAYSWDSKNADEHINLFTDDCIYQTIANGRVISEVTSSSERLIGFRNRFGKFESNGISTRHILSSMMLETGLEGQITGETYFYVVWNVEGKAAPIPKFTGIYRDTFSRTVDGWRISRHEVHLDQKL
jgi:3-phenylpropionate/cinnamic acid dioxygenase small subunit